MALGTFFIISAIPQFRISSNNSQIGFKSIIKSGTLNQNGFTHSMVIAVNLQVWYLQVRYLVYRTDILGPDFQVLLFDGASTS